VSDLLSALGTTAHSLDAQRYGLDVVGQNLANINTPGFTRRQIAFAEVPPLDRRSAGGGVDVQAVTAARTPLLDAQMYRERPASGRQSAVVDQIGVLETAFGAPGTGLDQKLSAFFAAFSTLAQSPTSAVARQVVVVQSQALAQGFRDVSGAISGLQTDVDKQVTATANDINALAARIAALNTAIGNAPLESRDALRDEQAVAVKDLSNLVDIGVIPRDNGGMDITIGNGRALVAVDHAYPVSVVPSPPQGLGAIVTANTDVTGEIAGGTLGGLLHVRDTLLPDYLNRLDTLASSVVSTVNGLHTAGFDVNGNPGVDFFTPSAQVAGTAAAMAVNPAIVSDTTLIAAAGVALAGDNQNARAIADLANGNPSPIDGWASLANAVGVDRDAASADLKTRQDVLSQIETLRQQISGVSVDEEAASMLRFQRAYEANARFFNVVNGLLDTFFNNIG
jgi:flagellar hook-associated protein 1 FlgK